MPKHARINARVTEEQWELFRRVAEAKKMSLSAFMVAVVEHAARNYVNRESQ